MSCLISLKFDIHQSETFERKMKKFEEKKGTLWKDVV